MAEITDDRRDGPFSAGAADGGRDLPTEGRAPEDRDAAGYRHEQVLGACQEEPEFRRRIRIERLLHRGKGLGSFPRSFRVSR